MAPKKKRAGLPRRPNKISHQNVLDLDLLRFVAAIDRTSNFREAAASLDWSIRTARRRLGELRSHFPVELFEASNGELIAKKGAGTALVKLAKDTLTRLTEIERASSSHRPLRIGYAKALEGDLKFFYHRLKSTLNQDLDYSCLTTAEIAMELEARTLDFGIGLSGATELRMAALKRAHLLSLPTIVLFSKKHSLAERKSVHLRDLANETHIWLQRRIDPSLRRKFQTACLKAGFNFHVKHEITDPESLFNRLENNDGVSLLPASYRNVRGLRERNLGWCTVDGPVPPWEFALVWRDDDPRVLDTASVVGRTKIALPKIAEELVMTHQG